MAGRLVLVLGDLFIPDRAIDIPPKFKKLLAPNKISQILFLGNATSRETYTWLSSIAPDVLSVRGDFDLPSSILPPSSDSPQQSIPAFPNSRIVQHGKLRIGFTHGHDIIPRADPDALLIVARKMDVDVLLTGATNRFEAFELEGKFFINPGSATGATGTDASWATPGGGEEGEGNEGVPSFVLMDVQGDVLVLYVYQLKKDAKGVENVAVEKVSFRKNGDLMV